MAVVAADLLTVMSDQTTVEVREKNLLGNLYSQYGAQTTQWANGANKVDIPIPDFATDFDEADQRARGGNWPNAAQATASHVELTRSDGYAKGFNIDMEDAGEINWDVVGRYRSRASWAIRHTLDTKAYDALVALPSTTITGGTAGSTFISNTAPYQSTIATNAQSAIIDAIERLSLAAYRLDVVDGEQVAGSAGSPFIIIQPELATVLRRDLRNLGLSLDPLTEETLRGNVGIAEGDGRSSSAAFTASASSPGTTWRSRPATPTGLATPVCPQRAPSSTAAATRCGRRRSSTARTTTP